MVLGEIVCGSVPTRQRTLSFLRCLPQAVTASHDEVMTFFECRELVGVGIGFIDAHLLAATALTPGTRLWTRDTRLDAAAARLGLRHTHDA